MYSNIPNTECANSNPYYYHYFQGISQFGADYQFNSSTNPYIQNYSNINSHAAWHPSTELYQQTPVYHSQPQHIYDGTATNHLIQQPYPTRDEHYLEMFEVLLNEGKFEMLKYYLQTVQLARSCHQRLQNMWFGLHYGLSSKRGDITGRSLNPVTRYRIRNKYPLPKTIWNGEKTSYSLRDGARDTMQQFFRTNKYPSLNDKHQLMEETGLELSQINNWFKNRRQRKIPKLTTPINDSMNASFNQSHTSHQTILKTEEIIEPENSFFMNNSKES